MDKVGLLAVRHTVENASNELITDDIIRAILQGVGGNVVQKRALFEDSSLRALVRAGVEAGVGLETILTSYAAARVTAVAVNPELDQALQSGW